jgi:hypothetical protein
VELLEKIISQKTEKSNYTNEKFNDSNVKNVDINSMNNPSFGGDKMKKKTTQVTLEELLVQEDYPEQARYFECQSNSQTAKRIGGT